MSVPDYFATLLSALGIDPAKQYRTPGGRPITGLDEARSLVEKMAKQFPTNRNVRIFVEEKQFDQMLNDPGFKQEAL